MGGTTATTVVAAVALGCQRLAGLAVELAVELAVALGARSVLVVGVVIWNHLCCDCGKVVSVDAFATVCWDHLHCLMQMFFRQRLESPPLVLQLRQRRLIFRQRLESTALVRRPPQQCLAVAGCDCERRGLALASSSREHSWIWRHRYRHSSAAPLQLRQRLDARLLRSSSYNSRTATSQTWQRHVLQLCQCLHIFCCLQFCCLA